MSTAGSILLTVVDLYLTRMGQAPAFIEGNRPLLESLPQEDKRVIWAAIQRGGRGMIRLLQWLILGHVHKWKTLHEIRLWDGGEARGQRPIGLRYIQQCEHCGKVIKRDLA